MGESMNSNIQVRSNLMVLEVDGKLIDKKRFFPGDYYALLYPNLTDSRVIEMYFSKEQLIDYTKAMVCYRCKKSCAGTCVRNYWQYKFFILKVSSYCYNGGNNR